MNIINHQKIQLSSEPADIATVTDAILNDFRTYRDSHPFYTFGLFIRAGHVAVPITSGKPTIRVEPALISHLIRQRYTFTNASGAIVDVPDAVPIALLAVLPFEALGNNLMEAQARHAARRSA
ncbi:hypothetical protein [Aminobacter aminovorans]|uniref:hypothetical protein n=1 Tax=Aminobacter aminovorans TaxID=83263 RepID=UPI0028650724|nr:hypothetical protein [Aminobacter aminovorans]MDR7219869.1 hypothetical protein [Aminobacter aminovorans]